MPSPYAAPASKVGDPPEPQHLFEKPLQIRIAVWLLWLLIVLTLPTAYFELRRTSSYGEAVVMTVFILAVLAFAAFINVEISRGRNWARIVFLVVVVISVAFFFLPDEGTRAISAAEGTLSVISVVVDIASSTCFFHGLAPYGFASRREHAR